MVFQFVVSDALDQVPVVEPEFILNFVTHGLVHYNLLELHILLGHPFSFLLQHLLDVIFYLHAEFLSI